MIVKTYVRTTAVAMCAIWAAAAAAQAAVPNPPSNICINGTCSNINLPLPAAAGYFVDCAAGSDADGGATPLTAWRTLNRVNSTVTALGADVYIKSGTVCADQRLVVDWSGSSSNPVVVGSYYMSGSAAHAGYAGGLRAEINGTYESSCRAASPSTCPVGINAASASAVPSSMYSALVEITARHVVVQDLRIADSSGEGVRHNGDTGDDADITVKNLDINQTFSTGIFLNSTKHAIISNNSVNLTALQRVDGRMSNWGAAIGVADASPSYVLIEGNRVTNSGGEGIFALRASHVVIRGNTVANNRRPLVYVDNTSDAVVENNMLLGNGYMNGTDESFGVGVAIAVEPYTNGSRDAVRNIIRNNLLANTRGCFDLAVFTSSPYNCTAGACDDPAAAGRKIGARIAGNTCLQSKDYYIGTANLTVNNNVERLEVVNNLFSETPASSNCNIPALPSGIFYSDSNHFGSNPQTASCRGSNSTVGATGVSLTFAGVNATTVPSWSAFRPAAGSLPQNSGVANSAVVIDISQFPSSVLSFTWTTCAPNVTEWAKTLSYDYACQSRIPNTSVGGVR